ncbi:hypothetical protein KPH14_002732 [Odynerus spinipes]|uniref:Dolichyl-diphosphooligosaccharide-protein glycosyltransferase subunit TMEM258 n=1 Tax=Odynerus spinipes TaxID=1348599 RepID=A0AAD9RLT1_9HYME|nr:hypothetical protein KPH14_002732 [Odynerus spinipes]
MMEIESMTRYVSPVNPAIFSLLAIVLLGIGIFFTAWFFVYELLSFLDSASCFYYCGWAYMYECSLFNERDCHIMQYFLQ